MPKKIALLLGIILSLFFSVSCSGISDGGSNGDTDGDEGGTPPSETTKVEAISDADFQKGFNLMGLDSAIDGNAVKSTIRLDRGTIDWRIGQWYSAYDLNEAQPMVTTERMKVSDTSKTVELDRTTDELTLELAASEEYTQMAESRVRWAHLLIEQSFEDFDAYFLDSFESLDVTLDFTMNKAEKSPLETKETSETLPAQFLQYFYVVNMNPESEGYGSFLWFGLGYMDTRYEIMPLSYLQDFAGGTAGNYIYCLGAEETLGDKPFEIGRKYEVRIDILPYIETALQTAAENGFMLNTKLSDCVITGMNLGFEVVGIWDVSVTLSNLSLSGTLKN